MSESLAMVEGGEKMSWTEDRVDLLKRMWGDGLSASQIAGRLGHGVTRNAVIGKVHRLNLAGRAAPPKAAVAAPQARKLAEPSRPGRPAQPSLPTAGNTALKPVLRPMPVSRTVALAAPEPLRLVDTPRGGRVTILQLSDKTCKWPIGDPGQDEFCFCGHKPRESAPYCEYHARMAYQPLQDRRPPRRPPGE